MKSFLILLFALNGFDATLAYDQELCGGNLIANSTSQRIEPPSAKGKYLRNLDCLWEITTDLDDDVVVKIGDDFDIEGGSNGCLEDYLEIDDEHSLTKYCGVQKPMISELLSSGQLRIHFVSNEDYNVGIGFRIEFYSKPMIKCHDIGGEEFCLNGGICNGKDHCSCPETHTGYRCVYSLVYHDDDDDDGDRDEIFFAVGGSHEILFHTCSLFGRDYIKTFDGKIFSFNGICQYQLVNTKDEELQILMRRDSNCIHNVLSCVLNLTIRSSWGVLVIQRNGVVTFDDEVVMLPFIQYNIYVVQSNWYFYVTIGENKITIDLETFSVNINIEEYYYNKVSGLCGNYNGSPYDDIIDPSGSHIDSDYQEFSFLWSENQIDENCLVSNINKKKHCQSKWSQSGVEICRILSSALFRKCHRVVSPQIYIEACISDICRCNIEYKPDCYCSVISQYVYDCAQASANVGNWRLLSNSCVRKCPGNQIYSECVDGCANTCEMVGSMQCEKSICTSGCQCKEGMYWNGDLCVRKEDCFCVHGFKKYEPGQRRKQECNSCTCEGAVWSCTEKQCGAHALITGFSHYQTFDGTWFVYTGQCVYTFMVAQDVTAYIDTQQCGKAGEFTCLRKFIISVRNSKYITFINGGEVLVDAFQVTTFPIQTSGVEIIQLSSLYIELRIIESGLSVLWDTKTTIHVKLPPSFMHSVHGLGGNFNGMTNDDLTTKSGLVSTAASFGNSWKFYEYCEDVGTGVNSLGACYHDAYLAKSAAKVCSVIKSSAFQQCRMVIPDYQRYFDNCKQDVCACESGNDCFCDSIAVFAQKCAAAGVVVNWRSVDFCEIPCYGGMVYQANGTRCERTCRSQMEPESCLHSPLVGGCNCPDGMYLSNDQTCVPLKECPCYHEGEWANAGHVTHKNSVACYCVNGKITCNSPEGTNTTNDVIVCPDFMHKITCNSSNQMGSKCLKTCANKDIKCIKTDCQPGCVCPGEYVYHKGQCIYANDCPCEFNGVNYDVGIEVKDGCKKLLCTWDGWVTVSNGTCTSQCKVVGGNYFETFDGKQFDFSGSCEYTLATDNCGQMNSADSIYRISIKSHDCPGSNRAMCATTVKFAIGKKEYILNTGENVVERDTGLASSSSSSIQTAKVDILHRGFFTIIATNIGIHLIWDGKTRVYINIENRLQNNVTCGMCGDFNGNQMNEFLLPTNHEASSAYEFGDSWKTNSLCPDASMIEFDCGTKLTWVHEKCNIINSDIFSTCHSAVDPTYYFDKCIKETCSCDTGGDCECFCTAVADYAYACGNRGVPIEWRSPEICPTMCEAYNEEDQCLWKYHSCGPACVATCCTTCFHGCFEGCFPKCPEGMVYDETERECIFPHHCNTCNEIDECYCEYGFECIWGNWTNEHKITFDETGGDFENVPVVLDGYECRRNFECQSVDSKVPSQKNVQCNSGKGLLCYNKDQAPLYCYDYEVRVEMCSCNPPPCFNVECLPTQVCASNEVFELVGLSDDTCCNVSKCICTGCLYDHEFKHPEEEWVINCVKHRCVPDDNDCYKVVSIPFPCPSNNISCSYFARPVPSEIFHNDSNVQACCNQMKCECLPQYSIIPPPINCTFPQILKQSIIKEENVDCAISECVCPEIGSIDFTKCLAPKQCNAPGCRSNVVNSCGCITSSECECDLTRCPIIECVPCYRLQTLHPGAKYPVYNSNEVCENSTCCPVEKCVKISCRQIIKCQPWEKEVFRDVPNECCLGATCVCDPVNASLCPQAQLKCAPQEEKVDVGPLNECCRDHICKCVLCVDGGYHKVNAKWQDVSDTCITKTCQENSDPVACPIVVTYRDKRNECSSPLTQSSCGKYEKLIETVPHNRCCKVFNCTCKPYLCPSDPTCEHPDLLVKDESLSDECCEVKKCQPRCFVNGQYLNDSEVFDDSSDACYQKICMCYASKCWMNKIQRNTCPNDEITCVNGYMPVVTRMPNDSCCNDYDCTCVCRVFGDPHYITFDGSYYTFHGQCQYTLVKDKYDGDLHIYSDNIACGVGMESYFSCLKTVYVNWKGTTVTLSLTPDKLYNILVNGSNIILPYVHYGIEIYFVGKTVELSIPVRSLILRYTAMVYLPSVVIIMPPTKVSKPTSGLCGTCTNDMSDDYEGKSGIIFNNTNDFGYDWEIKTGRENCTICDPDVNEACRCNDSSPSRRCQNCSTDFCNIFHNESIFGRCIQQIDPKYYSEACAYDSRALGQCDVCSSSAINAYAEVCLSEGICVHLSDNCKSDCPGNMVYKSCVNKCSMVVDCYHLMGFQVNNCVSKELTSGCFCEDGYALEKPGSNHCIKIECCSCPPDPICEGNTELTLITGEDPEACCSKKNCTCVEPTVIVCDAPKVLETIYIDGCSIYRCVCPLNCTENTKDCTSHLGCRVNVTQQDECGCPIESECVCNTDLCPQPPECDNCSSLVVILVTSSSDDACNDCCTSYICSRIICILKNPDCPIGQTVVDISKSEDCCANFACKCTNCVVHNGAPVSPGEIIITKDSKGCIEKQQCLAYSDPGFHNKMCLKMEIIYKQLNECQTLDNFENLFCDPIYEHAVVVESTPFQCCDKFKCICNEQTFLEPICPASDICDDGLILKEVGSSIPCCKNYTCDCEEIKIRCSLFGEVVVYVENNQTKCLEPQCVCTNDKPYLERFCLPKVCRDDQTHVEVKNTKSGSDGLRCCPEYECICKNCTECGEGYTLGAATYSECCPCHCSVCKTDFGTYKPGEVWNVTENSCLVQYRCSLTQNGTQCPYPEILNETKCQTLEEFSTSCNNCQCAIEITYTDETGPNQCCTEYECLCNVTLCAPFIPNCPANKTLFKTHFTTEDCGGCCPLYICQCDYCESDMGNVNVNATWQIDVGDGCKVTYGCSADRVTTTELHSKEACHLVKKISDPRTNCISETAYENQICTYYQMAVKFSNVSQYNPCCPEYHCKCKPDIQLHHICANDSSITCPEYMHVEQEGYVLNTSYCCPKYGCVCDSKEELSKECGQWTNYTCPIGNDRIEVHEKEDCCPEYKCVCKHEEMLSEECEHWNFTCPLGQVRIRTNKDCCPSYECVCGDKCLSNNIFFPLNSTWTVEEDMCKTGTCYLDLLKCPAIEIKDKYECDLLDENLCIENGGRVLSNGTTNGCCKYCEKTSAPCTKISTTAVLNVTLDEIHHCSSINEIELNSCSGSCTTQEVLNEKTGELKSQCRCCKAVEQYGEKHIEMYCDDGIKRPYKYPYIVACACLETVCQQH